MELKEYQGKVIDRFSQYVSALDAARGVSMKQIKALKDAGAVLPNGIDNFAKQAWNSLREQKILPEYQMSKTGVMIPEYVDRFDMCGRSIPNICLKVPTGGGKTLLASECAGKIQTDFFKRQTGLVLWVVPTVAIYNQTLKTLANREHPYRQVLERYSGGRVKIFEKDDPICLDDTKNHLCIMLVRLAATGRKDNKDFLKIFRDAGKYSSFFPEVDDYSANNHLLNKYPDLELNDFAEGNPLMGISIRHSFVNMLKMLKPIIIVDEGHKAYSDSRRESLNAFNPSFIIELTATPNPKKHISNILVDVSGVDLKDEQMIKLPINIVNSSKGNWESTLNNAHDKLEELNKDSQMLQANDGRYIRPIMVIRVERTGKDQRDGTHIHSLDAKQYLMEKLNIAESQIRIKSSTEDELGDTDLLDPLCPVKYIITKEALQEGWDCPFAYVLALLDKTKANTAMTQMIGRVLRQPDTRSTSIESLNQCYVYTFDQNVKEAVNNVRKGLEEEGLTGLGDYVCAQDDEVSLGIETPKLINTNRNPKFLDTQVFLPKVMHSCNSGFRDLNYEMDILSEINWSSLAVNVSDLVLANANEYVTITKVNVHKDPQLELGLEESNSQKIDISHENQHEYNAPIFEVSLSYMSRQLSDIVPNPWQACRIIQGVLESLYQRGENEENVYKNRLYIIEYVKLQIKKSIEKHSEKIFRDKLSKGVITFKLFTTGNHNLNFEIAHTLEQLAKSTDKKLIKKNNDSIENNLFEFVLEKDLNNLEESFALYLSDDQSIKWWHRMVAKQDYSLQGWQKHKIYPDFLACSQNGKLLVLETKGLQLKGNDDTQYKEKLFSILNEYHDDKISNGELTLNGEGQEIVLKMLLEDSWMYEYESLKEEL